MKKNLLSISLIFCIAFAVEAQDTIVGWDFSNESIVANFGDDENIDRRELWAVTVDTSAQYGEAQREVTFTNGVEDFAATATNWDGGADIDSLKYWSIKFKAIDVENLIVSSKQRAGGNNGGPKNFKLQYLLKNGEWTDIPGGTVVVANDWTTGVVDQLALPEDANNHNNESIFIRWIMTDNEDINGGVVTAEGISKIDDIFISGTVTTKIDNVEFRSVFNVYPNPAATLNLSIKSDKEIDVINIYTITGKLVKTQVCNAKNVDVEIDDLNAGIYIIEPVINGEHLSPKKVIIQ